MAPISLNRKGLHPKETISRIREMFSISDETKHYIRYVSVLVGFGLMYFAIFYISFLLIQLVSGYCSLRLERRRDRLAAEEQARLEAERQKRLNPFVGEAENKDNEEGNSAKSAINETISSSTYEHTIMDEGERESFSSVDILSCTLDNIQDEFGFYDEEGTFHYKEGSRLISYKPSENSP